MTDINGHIKNKYLEWGNYLKSKILIYLDTNFWIDIIEKDTVQMLEIRDLSHRLVEEGKCLFPMSEITFWEIFKQGDPESRTRTFKLTDKLSNGFSIITVDELIKFQCLDFLHSRIAKPTHDLDQIIWTKTILLAGLEPEMFNIQTPKEFYDFVSEFPLGQLNTSHIKPFSFKTNIADLNREKLLHHQSKSFDEFFLSELAGTLDANRTRLDPIHPRLVEFIFDQYHQKRITSELPHFRIFPTLFASAMQNKQLKFKENDTMDYFHATCALPFFDYFFTEKTLHNTIHQRKLDVRFSCQVESNYEKIIQLLKSILQN